MLRYGKNQELKDSTNYLTPQLEDIIKVKENLRDLGITMFDNTNFKNHIQKVCEKEKQKYAWVLRTFETRDISFLKFLWKTLIQGHID